MTCLVLCTVCRCRKWGPRIVRDQFSKIGNHYAGIWNTKKLQKIGKNSWTYTTFGLTFIIEKSPNINTYFWWEKLAVFQTRFLKTDHCAPERHRHQSHGYGNGFTKLFNSERWWVWESLCFFLFFQFSLFVFFIQSEKVNVAALQFCNCFHIHSIQSHVSNRFQIFRNQQKQHVVLNLIPL